MTWVEKIAAVLSLVAVIVSVAVTFGIQMERLARLKDDVAELKMTQQEIMRAIGRIENSRWRERNP